VAIPDIKKTFETDFCGRRLIVETGYIAEQAKKLDQKKSVGSRTSPPEEVSHGSRA